MKILIMDDEELAIKRLSRFLDELNYTYEVANNLNEFNELEQNCNFDVYILDINMPDINGLDLAQDIFSKNANAFIVFQTAYEEFALKAFKLGAIDYLLKPFTKEELDVSIKRAISYSSENKSIKFLTKNGDEAYLLKPEDIVYIQADLNEVIFRTKTGFSYYSKKISDMQDLLKGFNFFRVHRSYIINLDYIKSMKTQEQSKIEFFFVDIKDTVTSSKDGAKKFREHIER
ncbi:LytTR family DNA-binding domain-containing protein [Arcobacter sp. CECT 8985]|uniref:LytR/AlgR family response regulator transcription factor n=1 Tax=Arcobacter sp. CECT 8985 TaxID=1935424 RepID=UPI00100BC9DE|nr:LytTR family DNA-binding domain-containing protein [Arcobacter sp. CECT 8985]RXJ84572.1 DNA-binding response regulator [Arcobacter sp. CECT 8985]